MSYTKERTGNLEKLLYRRYVIAAKLVYKSVESTKKRREQGRKVSSYGYVLRCKRCGKFIFSRSLRDVKKRIEEHWDKKHWDFMTDFGESEYEVGELNEKRWKFIEPVIGTPSFNRAIYQSSKMTLDTEGGTSEDKKECPYLCYAYCICTAKLGLPFNEDGIVDKRCLMYPEHIKCDAYISQTSLYSNLLSARQMVGYENAKFQIINRIHVPRPDRNKTCKRCSFREACEEVMGSLL
ncbi:MAG: hypothetical protein KAT65_09245 [Methanophagales archaeon]|nr:hypothetical protein [Methanophagales archaeon]